MPFYGHVQKEKKEKKFVIKLAGKKKVSQSIEDMKFSE